VFEAFQDGLRRRGYVPGQNITLEWRGAEGREEQLPRLAAELVHVDVDVLVAETYPAIVAAKHATSTVPIVMAVSSDPIEAGLIESLSRPGGNITGLTTISTQLNGKRLQLLKEAFPRMSRLAIVWASLAAPDKAPGIREAQRIARELGLEIQYIEIRKSEDCLVLSRLDASKNLSWSGSGDHDSMMVVRDGGIGCGGKPGSSTSMSV